MVITKAALLDIFERVVRTYVYSLIIAVVTAGAYDIPTVEAAAWAAIPAAASLLYNLIAQFTQDANGLNWWQDALKRSVLTFFQVFAMTGAQAAVYDADVAKAALQAAVGAVLSIVTSALASQVGDPRTAGFLQVVPGGVQSGPPPAGDDPQDVADAA